MSSQSSNGPSALLTRPADTPSSNPGAQMLVRAWFSGIKDSESARDARLQANLHMLIEDVLGCSSEMASTQAEPVYVGTSPSAADALVAARQLQIAVQGFRRKFGSRAVSVSVVVDAPSSAASAADTDPPAPQPPSANLLALVDSCRPAQILLAPRACETLSELRGLPLRPVAGRSGVHEYVWTTAEALDVLQSEPELTLSVVKTASPVDSRPIPVVSPGLGRHIASDEEQSSEARSFPYKAVLAAACVLLLIVAGIWYAGSARRRTTPQPSSAQQPPIDQPAGPTARQAPPTAHASAPAPDHPIRSAGATETTAVHEPVGLRQKPKPAPVADATPAPEPRTKRQRHARADTEAGVNPAPSAPVASKCALPGNLADYTSRAEYARARGDYQHAISLFQQVLDCDPSNESARRGLERSQAAAQESPQ